MRKFVIKSFARDCNPVIEKLDMLKLASSCKKARIKLLRSFPIFKQYILIYHYRNIIYRTPFPPYFFFEFDSALLDIKFCMAMYPINGNLSSSAINKIFLKKSSNTTTNAKSFYTDESKTDNEAPVGASVFSPEFNLCIMHRLPAESSVFSVEAWAIYLAINAISDFNCDKAIIFTDSKSVLDALVSPLSPNRNYLIHYIKYSWLNCIRKGTELYIFWIPAHKGIPDNEKADSLAKKRQNMAKTKFQNTLSGSVL